MESNITTKFKDGMLPRKLALKIWYGYVYSVQEFTK
jgi:predicted DNA-binding transcriptional regulator